MSHNGRSRRNARQPARQSSRSQAARQLRPKELEKEIWTRRDAKIPGNPRYTDHAPMFSQFVNVQGDTVPIIRSRTVEFDASAAGIEKSVIHSEVLEAPGLWQGPWHHVLTNALRYLQACCVTDAGHNGSYDDKRLMRAGISPTDLLKQAGMDEAGAVDAVKTFKKLDLLEFRQNGSTQCWFVHLTFKGLGPSMQKYTRAELIDGWALPEEVGSYPIPTLEEGDDEVSDDGTDDSPPPEEESEEQADARLRNLRDFYRVALKYVPENPEFEDGFAIFTTPGPLVELAAEELGLSRSQAGMASANLNHLDIYKSLMIGQGRFKRFIRLDVQITQDHIDRIRKDARDSAAAKRARPKKAPKGRMEHLATAYQIVSEEAPEGLEPDENGFVEFEANHSFSRIFCERIEGLSERQAEELLKDLNYLGLLSTTPLMRGRRPIKLRKLKLGKKITQRDLEKVRALRRDKVSTRKAKSEVEAPSSDSTPDELEAIFAELAERMDGYVVRIEQLEEENKQKDKQLAERDQRIQELLAQLEAKPSAATVLLPEGLRKHLARK